MRRARLALMLSIAAHPAAGQAVGGRVVGTDSVAVAGAIVTVIDAGGTALSRALTDEQGRFNVRMPAGGRYSFRVMRLAHATTEDGPVAVSSGEVAERVVVASGAPVALPPEHVEAGAACSGGEGTGAGALLWAEVRKALLASQLTRLTRAYTMDVELYVRRQSPDRTQPPTMDGRAMTGTGLRSLSTAPPERLAADGYVTRQPTGDRYHAPDDEVLLSESFAATHCVRLLPYDREAQTLRLAFAPLPDRTQPEIRGEIDVDRATLALRRVGFTYVNVRQAQQIEDATGEIGFRRLPEGSWIIDSWALSLPFLEQYVRQEAVPASTNRAGVRSAARPAVVLTGTGWRTSGGAVTRIRFGEETVWSGEPPAPPDPRRRTPRP